MEYIKDYITGVEIPNQGPEENRQLMEKFLIDFKGFKKEDIYIDHCFEIEIEDSLYKTKLDLVIKIQDKILAAVKVAAGSISSWEREIIAGARILVKEYQIPFAIVTDSKEAYVFNTMSGKRLGTGLNAIPSRTDFENYLKEKSLEKFPPEKLERQKMVFRTYDTLNINR